MLLVKTKIAQSAINGIGLFADEFIQAGTPTWKFVEGFDATFSKEEIEVLSEPAKTTMLKYCYWSERLGQYVLCMDDARFMNHSEEPNITGHYPDTENTEGIDVAARDIQPGEELTCDYRSFDSVDALVKGDLFS